MLCPHHFPDLLSLLAPLLIVLQLVSPDTPTERGPVWLQWTKKDSSRREYISKAD